MRAGPAAVAFSVGDALVHNCVGFMLSMPILILIASVCPDGAVSTVFALVTSIQAAGTDVGAALSASLSAALRIKLHDFSSLSTLIVLCCLLQVRRAAPRPAPQHSP